MNGAPNLVLPTLGGRYFWCDCASLPVGGRIQRNRITGHWRMLDDSDRRCAWGWTRIPECPQESANHAVVLLAGIWRSRQAMSRLTDACRQRGWSAWDHGYPTSMGTVRRHAQELVERLHRSPPPKRLSFITHSMGGLVARQAQDLLRLDPDPAWRQAMENGRTCQLFPPNQGSAKAQRWAGMQVFKVIVGPAGRDLVPSGAKTIPHPIQPCLVIAGATGNPRGRSRFVPGDDDGTVGVCEAALPGCRLRTFPVGHTWGMNDAAVIAAAMEWLAGVEAEPRSKPDIPHSS